MVEHKIDEAKGRLKKAVGALTDDERLQRDGDLDKVAGAIKRKTEEFVDAVKDKLTGDVPKSKS